MQTSTQKYKDLDSHMLKPKTVTSLLQRAHSDNIKSILITTLEGSLLAFSGASERSARIFAAISSNIWNIYEKNGKGISQHGVNQLMINCENGKLLSMRLSKKLVLCIVGNDDVEFGLLKSKAVSLKSALEEPMKQIMESS